MVLEPLSAFAVACNVLQLVETGVKVISRVSEYRSAVGGELAEYTEMRTISSSLVRLNQDLQASTIPSARLQTSSTAEQRLVQCNAECLRLSSSFVELLNELKPKGPSLFAALRTALKSSWSKEKLDAMNRNLSRARDNLILSFLVYMDSKPKDHVTQQGIQQQNLRLEVNILQAVNSSSSQIHNDIKHLTQKLETMNLDASRVAYADFRTEHETFLHLVSEQLNAVCAANTAAQARVENSSERDVHLRIKKSLDFAGSRDRRDHILPAYNETYRWILSPNPSADPRWDSLVEWLADPRPQNSIYWIRSKPGAGKSSLIRFLGENLIQGQYTSDWARGLNVVQLEHYFWNAGTPLQKSLVGFMRTLLLRLLDEFPALISHCTPGRIMELARIESHEIVWSMSDLRQFLLQVLSTVALSTKMFIFVDGLDEIDGGGDAQDELVRLLQSLAAIENIKLCVSSRAWTVFNDAFDSCPQLRLEDLNAQDIQQFVNAEFHSQNRYKSLLLYDAVAARKMIETIVVNAEGVFLWARLVVKELIRGLRDGDSVRTLLSKLDSLPTDLDEYFQRLLESIEPGHRREASLLLQIAVAHMDDEITVTRLILSDLIFVEDAGFDFSVGRNDRGYLSIFRSAETTFFTLETTLRKVMSKCKGILEVYWNEDHPLSNNHLSCESTLENNGMGVTLKALERDRLLAFSPQVDLMHRSLRDYLLQERPQAFLQRYTGGPFDARNYMRNARLVQIFMMMNANLQPSVSVALASYLVTNFSVGGFRETTRCADLVAKLEHSFAYVSAGTSSSEGYWYIQRSLSSLAYEESNFLTLAIDFALTGWLAVNLTQEAIRAKTGRPVLDYVLRPRFSALECTGVVPFGNQFPHPDLVEKILAFGADPNETVDGISLWALFLSFIADTVRLSSYSRNHLRLLPTAYALSLEAMLKGGAELSLSSTNLTAASNHGLVSSSLSRRWLSEARWPALDLDDDRSIPVLDIVECFVPVFGEAAIDGLRSIILQKSPIGKADVTFLST